MCEGTVLYGEEKDIPCSFKAINGFKYCKRHIDYKPPFKQNNIKIKDPITKEEPPKIETKEPSKAESSKTPDIKDVEYTFDDLEKYKCLYSAQYAELKIMQKELEALEGRENTIGRVKYPYKVTFISCHCVITIMILPNNCCFLKPLET